MSSTANSSRRQRGPQVLIALDNAVDEIDGVDVRVEQAAGLQIEHLAEDVGAQQVEVVVALAVRQAVVKLTGLGVDEVGGKVAGAAPKERVRQRAVAPVEPLEMQAHHQNNQRVENPLQRVVLQSVAEQ
jgi:hypothetical protein